MSVQGRTKARDQIGLCTQSSLFVPLEHMHADVRKAEARCCGELVMILEPSPYPHLKVVRLPDVEDIPVAIGDWTDEPIERRKWIKVGSSGVKLELIPSAIEAFGVSVDR